MGRHEVFRRDRTFQILLVCIGFFLTAGCAGVTNSGPHASDPGAGSEARSGFLDASGLPDIVTFLPAPPAPGSAAFAADEERYRATRAFRNTPRWGLAARDADLRSAGATEAFSCAAGIPITKEATPRLQTLMLRSLVDAARATYAAKDLYRRIRPFVVNKEATCTPQDEAALARNGSYPSGHSSIGWTWALLLTEVAPDRTNPILSRGYGFGESRVVCGVHWESDVAAGRVVAAAVVSRLHADPAFRSEMEAARTEVAAARAKGLEPRLDCREEAEAMAYGKPRVP